MDSRKQLVERRELVMDRVDAALAAYPSRMGSDYEREMTAAVEELESIAAEMRKHQVEPREQSRTQSSLGCVCSDLAPVRGHGMLELARDHYLEAERLLEGHGNDLDQAKLNFNFANTLRQLDPNDVEQLREAKRRFLKAQAVFAREAPQSLSTVEEALRSVEGLLAVAPVAAGVERSIADMKSLMWSMKNGGEQAEISEKAKEIMARNGGIAGVLGRVTGALGHIPEEFKHDPRFGEIQEQLAEIGSQVSDSSPGDPREAAIVDALRNRLSEEQKAGNVPPGRASGLGRMISQIGNVLAGGDDLKSLMRQKEELRRGAEERFEILHYLSHGVPIPPAGCRANELVELWWQVRRFLIGAMNRPDKGTEESRQVLDLNTRAIELDRLIYDAGSNDQEAARLEREELRPLALNVRRFAAAPHAMIARPIWRTARASTDAGAVFCSGSTDVCRLVGRLATRLGLSLQRQPGGEGFAAARWEQLQKAATCVFDLSGNDRPDRAAVCYELGIALTLGKPIIVVSDTKKLPFDIDVPPVLLTGVKGDELELLNALDRSIFWIPSPDHAAGPADTVRHVLESYRAPGVSITVDQMLKQIERLQHEPDPVALATTLRTLVDFLHDGDARVIQPTWAPVYPDLRSKRLFHVMPFRPEWADGAVARAEAVCEAVGADYVRGDQVSDPDVIRSIWEEINRSSHVLVDLTGFNSNVALEAGIAHTLGRPTMLTGHESVVKDLFPNIAKLRIHPWRDAKSPEVGALLEAFLT